MNKLFLFLFCIFIYSDELKIRHVGEDDYKYTPYKEEGYLQGWNFFFKNTEYNIILNFLVSNLGPNDLNNGVSLSIQSKKTGSVFLTKEFGVKDLEISKNEFKIKSYNNLLEFEENKFKVSQFFEDIKIYLEFETDFKGATLSGGKYFVKENEKFVKADIPFSFVKTKGYIDFKGEIIELEGLGGLEHLLTNYEVYKYSSKWELVRGVSSNGFKIYSGGFYGKEKSENDFFRTLVVQKPNGEFVLSGKILKSEILKETKDNFSGYMVTESEKIYLSETCFVKIDRGNSTGKINILSNISAVLRFFVRLFFTNPYQLNYEAKITLDCKEKFPKEISFNSILTYYLINSK